MTPNKIKKMDNNVLFVRLSLRTRNESKGTKIYPRDSNIGISLRFTP